jgi:hypothetical protein
MDIGWHEFEGYFDRLTASRPERADLRDSTPMIVSDTRALILARRQVGAASEFSASVSASLNATSNASTIDRNPQRKIVQFRPMTVIGIDVRSRPGRQRHGFLASDRQRAFVFAIEKSAFRAAGES